MMRGRRGGGEVSTNKKRKRTINRKGNVGVSLAEKKVEKQVRKTSD